MGARCSLRVYSNKGYYGKQPTFDKLSFAIIKTRTLATIKTGEIDITKIQYGNCNEVLNKGDSLDGQIKFKTQRRWDISIWDGMPSSVLQTKEVRQAMTMAFNREEMIKSVFSGLETHNRSFAQQSECYDKNVKLWPFDLQKAAAKLEETGWKDTDGDGIETKLSMGQGSVQFQPFGLWQSMNTTLANIYREDCYRLV